MMSCELLIVPLLQILPHIHQEFISELVIAVRQSMRYVLVLHLE